MATREWLSKEHKIFRTENGNVWARPNIPGIGRKEFSLEKSFTGNISEINEKLLRSWVACMDRKIAELTRQQKATPAALWRFEALAQEIIESKKKRASATFESALIHFEKHLIPWVNEHAPYLYQWEERGETFWQEYIDSKRAQSPRIKFLNHRKHLNMVLLAAFKRGIISRKISLYDPDPEIDAGRVLSHEEIRRLYRAASGDLRDQIIMAFTMGLRKREILSLEWARVDFEGQEIIFHRMNTKTRRPRNVPMNRFVQRILEVRQTSRKGPYVFPSRYNAQAPQRSNKTAWQAAKRRAGVVARFHDLRHTFITNAIRAGENPILISKYAGVSQEVMSKVYCHLDSTDLQKLATTFGGKMGGLLS